MIAVDMMELEQLADLVVNIASNTEELLSQMQMIYAEMQDNPELPSYPQSIPAREALAAGIRLVDQTNASLQALKPILLCAVDEYQENEEHFRQELEQMLSSLGALQVNFSAVAAAAAMLPIEKDEETVGQTRVQQLVADSSSEMQLTNLAAVAKVIDEEYCVTNTQSTAQLAQDVEEAADNMALSDMAAAALRQEDEEEIRLAKGFQKTVAENRENLDDATDMAQKVRIDAALSED